MRQLSCSLFRELKEGALHSLLEFIKRDSSLDFQIRENYANVYYKGGNILKIKPKSFDIDKMYFHTAKDKNSTEVKQDKTRLSELSEKRKQLLALLPENPQEYFTRAKEIMDKWDEALSERVQHNEKKEQQQIAVANRNDTDYVVLDLEYAVSTNSAFAYNGKESKYVPRFDIIAIHDGRLVVIELKKGLGAVSGTSGVRPHIDCFNHTIGRDTAGLFVLEMRELLKQKQQLGLLDESLRIREIKPAFFFAYADKNEKENEFFSFIATCIREGYRGDFIYLNSIHKLSRAMNRDYYYDEQKRQSVNLQKYNSLLFDSAQSIGYDPKRKKRSGFVLRTQDKDKNLFHAIRQETIDYFKEYNISWWQYENNPDSPTGHLVSSQIHCLNHLFALRKDKEALKTVLSAASGLTIKEILPSPLDKDGYLTFEFVYKNKSLLGEKYETRGAKCTSIDALVYAQLENERKILFPIEWKYTETYYGKEATPESWKRYPNLISLEDSNLKEVSNLYKADPYYELMRQTLLCEQIIRLKDCEIIADCYFHIMVIPNAHTELKTAIESKYIPTLKDKSKFRIIDPQELLAPLEGNEKYSKLLEYLRKRYW